MAIAKLSIDLEIRLAKIEEGLRQSTRAVEKSAGDIERRFLKVGDSLKTLGIAIAGAFSARVLQQFFSATLNGLDALVDLRDATGASVENLSALEDVARRTGTSVEGMTTTLVKFNKVLSDATAGSETANILKSIGLDAEKLRSIDPAEALRQTAIALSRFADDGNKARIVQALFAKSIQEAGPFLNELAKQGKLNATVTTQQAEAAEKFKNELNSLQKNILDTARDIVGVMIPALDKFFAALNKGGGVSGIFTQMDRELKAEFDSAKLREAADAIVAVQKQINEIGPSPTRLRILEQWTAEYKRLQKSTTEASDAMKKFAPLSEAELRALATRGQAGGGRGFTNPDEVRPAAPGLADASKTPRAEQLSEAQRALAAYVDQLERERQKIAEISAEERAVIFLKELGTTGQIPQVRELVLGLAAELDQRADLGAMLKLQTAATEELHAAEERRGASLRDLLEQTPISKYGKIIDLAGELDQRFLAGKVSATQYAQALKLIDKALAEIEPTAEKAKDEVSEFTMEAARNIQDALGDTLLATLKGDFDSIGRLWGNMIQRMIAEALAANLGRALLGDFGKTGNIGGLFGDFLGLFGFAKGGAFANGVQAFAGGGIVNAPTLFPFAGGAGLMGEAGPEAIMPLRRGRDGKLGVSSDGGGITIINNVAAGVTRNEVMTGMQMIANSMRGEFKQTLRSAGVI